MGAWTWPAYVAVVVGVLLFFAILAPVLALQARLYGRLDARRLLGSAALSVYAVALVAYTLLPLPSGDLHTWCATHRVGHNLDLFAFVGDVRTGTAGMSLLQAATSTVVLQLVFNVALFVPWGLFARGFFGRGVLSSTVSALAASLLIETTQYTGIFGLIGCSYRVGDVDDLLMNTLGGLLGALLAPVVLRWMPRPRDLEPTRLAPRPLTVWRRWAGMFLDAAGSTLLALVVGLVYRVAHLGLTGRLPSDGSALQWWIVSVAPVVVWFVVPAFLGSGASWGQRTVWLAPVRPAPAGSWRRASLVRRLARTLAGGGGWAALGALASLGTGVPLLTGLSVLLAVVAVVGVVPTRAHRGVSAAVAGLDMVDVRALSPSPASR